MREHWTLDPNLVYLNHGSFGAVPVATQRERQRLQAESESNPMQWFRGLPPRLHRAREAIGNWLGVSGDDIALVSNATTGVNTALHSIPIAAGQRILLTDHGYGAVQLAAEHVATKAGASVQVLDVPLAADDDEIVSLVAAALDETIAAVVVDQITSATARVLPAERIAEVGKQRGVPVIVDGAHAPGLLDHPVVADFWTGNLHKWPCAPRGSGVLFVDPAWRAGVVPPTVSWDMPQGFPVSFDFPGTSDVTGWLAAPTSLSLLDDLDFADRRKEIGSVVECGAARVAETWGGCVVDVGTPAPTMRLLSLPDGLVEQPRDGDRLAAHVFGQTGVETACVVWNGHGYMRLSAHLYTTPDDFAVAADRLGRLFADRPAVAAAVRAAR